MPIRIGFDMDGVLADFGRAFHEVDERVFGPGPGLSAGQPEKQEQKQAVAGDDKEPSPLELRRRRDFIWKAIQTTPDFWSTLKPTEEGAVRRIHALMLQHGWEVFFITQRPKTEGDTVQRQTQRWLVEQGFDLPSVLVIDGSRGAAAEALRLDYHVDDTAQNCFDVMTASSARPILIVPENDEATVANARTLGIGTARSIGECLDILEQATVARNQPGLLTRLANMVGWK
jgi:hypothetical protein